MRFEHKRDLVNCQMYGTLDSVLCHMLIEGEDYPELDDLTERSLQGGPFKKEELNNERIGSHVWTL